MDLNLNANLFLYNSEIGDYYITGDKKVSVIKKTGKRIHLSDGSIINIKTLASGYKYLDSRSIIRKGKQYPQINQILRDIEGYLIYKIHC